MPTTDTIEVGKWIFQRLNSNQTLKDFVGLHPTKKVPQFYRGKPKQKATYPYIIYKFIGGTFKQGTGGRKIFAKMTWMIKIVSEGESVAPIAEAAGILESLFQRDQLATDEVVIGCKIDAPIDYAEEGAGGNDYNHLGFQLGIFTYNQINLVE